MLKIMFTNSLMLFALLLITSINPSKQQEDTSEKILTYFSNKCRTYSSNSVAFDNLRGHVSEFLNYMESTFTLIPNKTNKFCVHEQKLLLQRVEVISKDLSKCLPKEEQFLPEFMVESFKEFLHFLCHRHSENVKNFFSSQGKECRAALEGNTNEMENCFSRIFAPTGSAFTKTEICEDMKVAKKCFTVALEKRCPNFRAFQDLNEGFFTYISTPCSGCYGLLSNPLMLLLSLVLAFKSMY